MVQTDVLYSVIYFLLLFGLQRCQETTDIVTTDIASTELPLVELISTVRLHLFIL